MQRRDSISSSFVPALGCALVGILPFSGCVVLEDDGTPAYSSSDTYGSDNISGGGSQRGDLTIYYSFGKVGCADAGVDDIVVDVRAPGGGVESYATSCTSNPDATTITDLSSGTYEVWVEGYSRDGVLYYESAGWQAVAVRRGASCGYDVNVPATAGDLSLTWTFLGDPRCLDVHELWVTVEDPFGLTYDDTDYSCDFGGVVYPNVVSGDWYVWMDALDAYGNTLYSAEGSVEVLPYTVSDYELDLN